MSALGSLRAELFGATTKTPPFALLLPRGWTHHQADLEALSTQVRSAVSRVPGADRLRLEASIRAVLDQASSSEDQERLIGWITPTDVPPEEFVPMSLALAWIQAPAGTPITSLAKQLISNRGAEPLDSGGAILRWIDRANTPADGGVVHTVQPSYLIRVPHTTDTALIIRTTILDGADDEHTDEDWIEAMTALSDGVVSTFRWRKDA